MKRSALQRRTPLRTRTPMRSVGRKAKREAADLAAFRETVHARQWCELNTPACPSGQHVGHQAHHVYPSDRRRGVHDPARGLLACSAGHLYAHMNPAESYERGWLGRAS